MVGKSGHGRMYDLHLLSLLSRVPADAIITRFRTKTHQNEEWNVGMLIADQCPRTFRQYFLDSCAKYSDRTFLSSPVEPSGRRQYTFKEVLEQAEELSGWMRKRRLGMGSRIAIGGGNSAG